jgi:uncharacterized protein (TIGR00255 family)
MSDPKSMTGFGRSGGALSGRLSASVVVRSVNHRYLDVQVRTNLREELPEVEATVREVVASRVVRGRVSVQVNLQRTAAPGSSVLVDVVALSSLLEQLESVHLPDGTGRGISLGDVLALPGLVSVTGEETTLAEAELEALGGLVAAAVEQLVAMRVQEGRSLKDQILSELAAIGAFLDWFEPQMPSVRERLLERLQARLAEILGPDLAVERDRLLTEAALAADRSDVSEEVVRLRTHLEAFARRLDGDGAVGRTLDFLCQELNRELNTLGSKCREAGMAERLVDAKSATERIREQVQNLE